MALTYMRTQTEQYMRSKPLRSNLPWCLLQFLSRVPVLTSLPDGLWCRTWSRNKPFPLQGAWGYGISLQKQTVTRKSTISKEYEFQNSGAIRQKCDLLYCEIKLWNSWTKRKIKSSGDLDLSDLLFIEPSHQEGVICTWCSLCLSLSNTSISLS